MNEEVDHETSHHQGTEDRGADTYGEGNAEALYGASAEPDKNRSGDQRRHIRIHDGGCHLIESACGRVFDALAGTKFFTQTFKNQNVRIHTHTECEHERGDTGQSQSSSEAGKHTKHDDHVDDGGSHRDETAEEVINNHKANHKDGTPLRGVDRAITSARCHGRAHFIHFINAEFNREGIIKNIR